MFRLDPPDSPSGLDLVEAVTRRDLTGVSIGFRVMPVARPGAAASGRRSANSATSILFNCHS